MSHRFVRFILLCEGPSDQASIPFGLVRAAKTGRGNVIARKIKTVLSADPALDLVFLHRDANAVGTAVRTKELEKIMSAVHANLEWVPVIPVSPSLTSWPTILSIWVVFRGPHPCNLLISKDRHVAAPNVVP